MHTEKRDTMWKTKLCLGTGCQFDLPVPEQIRLFRKIGFDGFFTDYTGPADVKEQKRLADETGMLYQSVHAPFGRMKEMWETGEEAAAELMDCLRACAENGIPMMVAHTFIGFQDHSPNARGLENFGKVVAEAERLGVKVAFENTEGEEYLAAVMERFGSSPAVGFCWDTGHEMCYNHSKDLLALYGDNLIATHLNDNLGIRDYGGETTWIDDLHLLPFDGIADWADIADRLNRCNYNGVLTFELNRLSKPDRHENDFYKEMPIEQYLTLAYMRACRVAALLERRRGAVGAAAETDDRTV